jgi:type VI secretion system ImpM family protein
VVVPLSGRALSHARAFLFGKLPRHGDFVGRGLTPQSRQAWDGWLSSALDRSREELGEAFEAAHEAAPPWRFVRAPGPFGPDGQVGALAPSIDAAGRRFFIVVGGEGPPASAEAGIAEQMEDLIYRAFEEGLDADALAGAAQAVLDDAGEGETGAPEERWWTAETTFDRPPARLIGGAA